jgi:hypothetical protein
MRRHVSNQKLLEQLGTLDLERGLRMIAKRMLQVLAPMQVAILGGLGCSDDVACTLEARSSVVVKVLDAAGVSVTDAEVVFSVNGGIMQACTVLATSFVCGMESGGAFVITATRGIDMGTVEVNVRRDECHVITQTVELILTAP